MRIEPRADGPSASEIIDAPNDEIVESRRGGASGPPGVIPGVITHGVDGITFRRWKGSAAGDDRRAADGGGRGVSGTDISSSESVRPSSSTMVGGGDADDFVVSIDAAGVSRVPCGAVASAATSLATLCNSMRRR